MHYYNELVNRSVTYTLKKLDELADVEFSSLQTDAKTISIKNLQMIELTKAIMAIGLFSLLESTIQSELNIKNGFENIDQKLNPELYERFDNYKLAINVLKHGKGASYDKLVSMSISNQVLPFEIKHPDSSFFDEGDVSEINTLVKVDTSFVLECCEIVELVYDELLSYE